jgi:hypothetical protein
MTTTGVDMDGAIAAAMRRRNEQVEKERSAMREAQLREQLERDAEAATLVCMALGMGFADALAPVTGSRGDHAAHFAYRGVKFRLWKTDRGTPYGIALDVQNEMEPDGMQFVSDADGILAYIGERLNPTYYRMLSEGDGVGEGRDDE